MIEQCVVAEVANYRPIAIGPIFNKIFESIIYKKMLTFVQPLLSDRQYEFLPKRSTIFLEGNRPRKYSTTSDSKDSLALKIK